MENLGLDFKLILAQIINFALVFYIIKKFIATPFLAFLKKEKGAQEEKEKIGSVVQQKMEELDKEESKLKEKWKEEARVMLKKAQEEAEKEKAEIVRKGQSEVAELKAKAKRQIEEEKKTAEKEIRRKIVDLSIAIADRALKDYLDVKAAKEATQYIIKNFAHNKIRDEA